MAVTLQNIGKLFRPNIRNDIGTNLHILNTFPIATVFLVVDVDGHVAGVEQAKVRLVLIAVRTRHHKKHLHIVFGQTFGHTEASRSKAACDMGRKLPPEHQDSHFEPPFLFSSSIKYLR